MGFVSVAVTLWKLHHTEGPCGTPDFQTVLPLVPLSQACAAPASWFALETLHQSNTAILCRELDEEFVYLACVLDCWYIADMYRCMQPRDCVSCTARHGVIGQLVQQLLRCGKRCTGGYEVAHIMSVRADLAAEKIQVVFAVVVRSSADC